MYYCTPKRFIISGDLSSITTSGLLTLNVLMELKIINHDLKATIIVATLFILLIP